MWLWVRPCNHAATSGIFVFCHARCCATTGAGYGLRLSRCTSSSAIPRGLLEEFLILGLLALFALGNMAHYSSATLCLAVFSSMSGCCMRNGEHWILREMTLAVPQCLARRWLHVLRHYLALDELHIFSTLPWTRILRCLVFVLTQNGEECSDDTSVSVLVALLAPGNLEILSRVSRDWR